MQCCYLKNMADQMNLLETDLADETMAAFDRWLGEQGGRLSESSQTTYRYMWHSYVQFLLRVDLSPAQVKPDDLVLFLQGLEPRGPYDEDINEHYAWRALSLIKRVTAADAQHLGVPVNTAAADLLCTDRFRYINARGKEPLPKILEPRAARSLIQRLVADAASLGLKPSWKVERDRACLALMLGSGLTPMELRYLKTHDLFLKQNQHGQIPWKVSVAPTAKTVAHDAPIAGWARRVLTRWLLVRNEYGFEGDAMFPATRSSKAWTDVGCQAAATAMLIRLMGDEYRYGGLMRLRHTFVIRQRKRDIPSDRIALWLGIRDLERMKRYESVIPMDTEVS